MHGKNWCKMLRDYIQQTSKEITLETKRPAKKSWMTDEILSLTERGRMDKNNKVKYTEDVL